MCICECRLTTGLKNATVYTFGVIKNVFVFFFFKEIYTFLSLLINFMCPWRLNAFILFKKIIMKKYHLLKKAHLLSTYNNNNNNNNKCFLNTKQNRHMIGVHLYKQKNNIAVFFVSNKCCLSEPKILSSKTLKNPKFLNSIVLHKTQLILNTNCTIVQMISKSVHW